MQGLYWIFQKENLRKAGIEFEAALLRNSRRLLVQNVQPPSCRSCDLHIYSRAGNFSTYIYIPNSVMLPLPASNLGSNWTNWCCYCHFGHWKTIFLCFRLCLSRKEEFCMNKYILEWNSPFQQELVISYLFLYLMTRRNRRSLSHRQCARAPPL